MADMAVAAIERFGGIDILVANAGGHGAGTAADIPDDAWAQSWRAQPSVRRSSENRERRRTQACDTYVWQWV